MPPKAPPAATVGSTGAGAGVKALAAAGTCGCCAAAAAAAAAGFVKAFVGSKRFLSESFCMNDWFKGKSYGRLLIVFWPLHEIVKFWPVTPCHAGRPDLRCFWCAL